MSSVVEYLRRTIEPGVGAGLTDGELLECFIRHRDAGALTILVGRHGAMVWGVCRRILRRLEDAEDAFQATFLVLVRRASSILPREQLAAWLHGVAHQTARKARATAARRRGREHAVPVLPERAVADPEPAWDLAAALDREVSRLPERYRAVVILCDLEGRTRKEAAAALGVPEGTVAGRLARARALLARRLGGQEIGPLAAAPGVPAALLSATVEVVKLVCVGQGAGVVSAAVVALTEGVLQAMMLTRVKLAVVGLLVLVTLGLGTGGLLCRTAGSEPARVGPVAVQEPPEDLLDAVRLRQEVERQHRIQVARDEAVKAAKANIARLLREVEELTGDPKVALEALEDIEKAVREMREARQPAQGGGLWQLEFRFKNPRLISVDVPGKGRKAIWYCWYQVTNPTGEPHTFIPDFELVTGDKGHRDQVLPAVHEIISGFEDPARALDIQNSVTIARRPIPPVKESPARVTGLALWDDVSPDATGCVIHVGGLSNGWVDGPTAPRRKTLRLTFKRVDNEMQPAGPSAWVYRASKP
jgi:RNA polymerase sigma factor (sigma-70 family)